MIKDRVILTNDLWNLSYYLFINEIEYNQKVIEKLDINYKENLKNYIAFLEENNLENLKEETNEFIKSKNINLGKFMQSLRYALVGDLKGIDLFEIIKIINIKNTIIRINTIIQN